MNVRLLLLLPALGLAACSSDDDGGANTDDQFTAEVVDGMHQALLSDIDTLHSASMDIQEAAPSGHAWSASDSAAIAQMTAAWLRTRGAYERTEGALAPLFPDIDGAIDARYEDFLEEIGPAGDSNMFDGEGVTGMHAIERILFVDDTPASVVTLEASLPGYTAAAWPATAAEADAFKNELCAQLVTDTETLQDQWAPQQIDLGGAFQGLISLMNEQREKVNKAASDEEESRYAQRTMADIRENLAGTRKIYDLFKGWLMSKPNGEAIDADIEASFEALEAAYSDVAGDAIPQPPATWSSESPSAADLQTPFGVLYSTVNEAVDPNTAGSAVDGMNRAAVELGFPEFIEE